jgi:hypothetical protein
MTNKKVNNCISKTGFLFPLDEEMSHHMRRRTE